MNIRSKHHEEDDEEVGRKNSHKTGKRPIEPGTPSKNLFSPALRTDSVELKHHGHTHTTTHDNIRGISLVHHTYDDCNSPNEEIKQVSLEMSSEDDNDDHSGIHQPMLYHQEGSEEDDNGDVDGEEEEEDANDDQLAFNPYLFIAELPPHDIVVEIGKICLPPSQTPHLKTLVLDLDETLVHCSVVPMDDPDLIFPVL
jgi:hypothetical protein